MGTPEPILPLPAISIIRDHQRAAFLVTTVLLLLLIGVSLPTYPQLARFRDEALQALPSVLAPLVVLALFIERAVEVVLSAWRADGAQRRREALRMAFDSGTLDERWTAKAECERYTVESKKISFLIGFVLALLISMMGVRGIEMLVGDDLVARAPAVQQKLFVRVDMVVTALLLAGGAEGIHKIVGAFTSFLDLTQRNLRRAAGDEAADPTRTADARRGEAETTPT